MLHWTAFTGFYFGRLGVSKRARAGVGSERELSFVLKVPLSSQQPAARPDRAKGLFSKETVEKLARPE